MLLLLLLLLLLLFLLMLLFGWFFLKKTLKNGISAKMRQMILEAFAPPKNCTTCRPATGNRTERIFLNGKVPFCVFVGLLAFRLFFDKYTAILRRGGGIFFRHVVVGLPFTLKGQSHENSKKMPPYLCLTKGLFLLKNQFILYKTTPTNA